MLFKSLSDSSRIRIMELLREKEMYIGELSRALDIPLTTLTYHINMMHDADIIDVRTAGKRAYCSFKPKTFDKASLVLSSIS